MASMYVFSNDGFLCFTNAMKKNQTTLGSVLVVLAFVAIYLFGDRLGLTSPTSAPQSTSQQTSQAQDSSETVSTSQGNLLIMRDVTVYDLDGNLAYEGDIDLAPVFERIERGESDPHDNDGSVFGNREGLLPQKPRGYYREYVVRTPGMRSVGPQRLVLGEEGEAYYTSDHYESFTQVR
jgi:ribonuclease T1